MRKERFQSTSPNSLDRSMCPAMLSAAEYQASSTLCLCATILKRRLQPVSAEVNVAQGSDGNERGSWLALARCPSGDIAATRAADFCPALVFGTPEPLFRLGRRDGFPRWGGQTSEPSPQQYARRRFRITVQRTGDGIGRIGLDRHRQLVVSLVPHPSSLKPQLRYRTNDVIGRAGIPARHAMWRRVTSPPQGSAM